MQTWLEMFGANELPERMGSGKPALLLCQGLWELINCSRTRVFAATSIHKPPHNNVLQLNIPPGALWCPKSWPRSSDVLGGECFYVSLTQNNVQNPLVA